MRSKIRNLLSILLALAAMAVASPARAQVNQGQKVEPAGKDSTGPRLTPAGPQAGLREAKAVPGAKIEAKTENRAAPQGGTAEPKPPVNHPKAVEVINHYIDAMGGLKVLEAIQDKVQKFRVVKHAASGETTAAMNQYLKKDYKIREEWDIEGIQIKDKPLAFTQVYNGSEGWVQMFGTVSPLEGKTLGLFVWDKVLDDQLCHWEEDGYTVDYIGAGTVDKEPVEIIELTDFGGTTKKRYFFSKQTSLLLKQEWREQGQHGMAKKETLYKKYKKLPFSDNSSRAVQFALLHEIYEDGDLDTTREFTEVKFNSGLKDGIFERPEGEEFKGAIGGPAPAATAKPTTPPAALHPAVGHPPVGHPIGEGSAAGSPAAKPVVPLPTAGPAKK